jgi:hypothetical protein
MLDRSQLIRYANDTLLEEFQQRLTIQIRYIDGQIAGLKKELQSLQAERDHLDKFFPQAIPQAAPPLVQMPKPDPGDPIPDWLKQDKKAAE